MFSVHPLDDALEDPLDDPIQVAPRKPSVPVDGQLAGNVFWHETSQLGDVHDVVEKLPTTTAVQRLVEQHVHVHV